MPQDNEQEVRLQFLEEAQDYLDQIESGLLGLGNQGVNPQQIDAMLRAAHSLKGGGAMMGFATLSHLSHRLEGFFKVLKVGKPDAVDAALERLLLSSLDGLRQVVALNRQGLDMEETGLAQTVTPVFDQLHDRLGDPQPENETSLLSSEVGEDMCVLLFESEVEGCLQRLEAILAHPDKPCLVEEVQIAAQELSGLAEMLDLQRFYGLCQSVTQLLEQASFPDEKESIAQLAIQEWRRSQVMVLVGQATVIPTEVDLTLLPTAVPQSSSPPHPEIPSSHPEDQHQSELVEQPQELTVEAVTQESSFDALPESLEIEALELFSSLESLATDDEAQVSPEPISPEAVAPQNAQNIRQAESQEAAQSFAQATSPPDLEKAELAQDSKSEHQTIRVSVKQLNQLGELFGELLIERNGLSLQLDQIRGLIDLLNRRVATLKQSNVQLRAAYDKVATDTIGVPQVPQLVTAGTSHDATQMLNNGTTGIADPAPSLDGIANFSNRFDLLEMDRYSELHLLSQELMETAVQIQEVTGDINTNLEDAERTTRQLTRTSKQLQARMTQVRMRPLSDLLNRFPRLLRELSLQHGKQVELKIIGGSTLIDRSILAALNDPLIHLLRNAFDHGIEDPETRIARGKSPRGVIEVQAAYRGNQTIVTVRDDGSGINLEKIKDRATKMGLDQADIEAASDSQLLDLIFEPGFSTATQLTDLSGRGVGMDVVRTNLQQLGGSITVNTKPEEGTTFTITVPFTLSVVRVLLVESGNLLLAFPTAAIEEIMLLQPDQVLTHVDRDVLKWQDSVVPLIRLHQCLDFTRNPKLLDIDATPIINAPTVLMVAHGDELFAIEVDRYWGEQEVTIRQVEGNLALPPGFAGCTILGDGRIVPLVDAPALLDWLDERQAFSSQGQDPRHPLTHSPSEPKVKLPSGSTTEHPLVMVVDDSINVRRFLALTLKKAGYQVVQAKDGQHALEKLQAGLPVQAVVCDIEMPRLDGYGFLAHANANPDFKDIPVLMLTSRSGDKHRQLALRLGAKAYFSKPFREKELLETLRQLTRG